MQLGNLAHQDSQDQQDLGVMWDLLELRVHVVNLVSQDHQGVLDSQDLQVNQDNLVQQVKGDNLDYLVIKDCKDNLAREVMVGLQGLLGPLAL